MALALTIDNTPLPKQKRSRARRAAMIDHGLNLLRERDLDDVSVAEITSALGYSTGSFYSAFVDKAAFFVAVQLQANEHIVGWIEYEIETPGVMNMSLNDRLAICVDMVLRYFREFRGVLRSALRYEQKLPAAWEPNRVSAQRIADGLIVGLNHADTVRMNIAIQMAFGTMVNALLHDPGPLRLDDSAFGEGVKTALRPYLNERKD
ncbi:MAG: TetR/AcrR family transcriptional regulator [Pikeienuella sp.]